MGPGKADAGKGRPVRHDINGDGYADFLIGAPDSSADLPQAGQAFVFLGGPTFTGKPALTVKGEVILDQLGKGVAMAGDVNGDGFGDFLIQTNGNRSSVGTQAGRVLLFLGGPTLTASPAITFAAGLVDDANNSITGCGDLNGDGFDDIAFAATDVDANHGAIPPSRVEIHFGGPAMATAAPLILSGEYSPDFFGSALAAAGDVNGDGYPDLIVGAHQGTNSGGKVRLYFGGPAMDATVDMVWEGPEGAALFGFSVAGIGDVNGDGFADVAVGAPNTDAHPAAPGSVYVYWGGPTLHATPDRVLPGEQEAEWFGMAVAPAGDLDHDGYADLAVLTRGIPQDLIPDYSDRVARPGRVTLYGGGPSLGGSPLGQLMAGSGFPINQQLVVVDVTGDGEAEILVGQCDRFSSSPVASQVAIYQRSKNDSAPTQVLSNDEPDSWFGVTLGR